MENNEITQPNVNESKSNPNVFTKEVKPLSKGMYFLIGFANLLKKLGLWIADLLLSIVLSLWGFFKTVGLGIYKGAIAVYKFFENKVRQFKYNDLSGRLSFILFGASNFAHKQYANGVIYAAIEIGFIVFMILGGGYNLFMLTNLGLVESENSDWGTALIGDNSISILISGIFTIIIVLAFLYIWVRNINEGYKNHRIDLYITYRDLFKATEEFSKHIDNEAHEACKQKISKSNFKNAHQAEIESYLQGIDNPNPKYKEIVKYVINETINYAYDFAKKEAKQIINVDKAQLKHDEYVAKREAAYKDLIQKLETENKSSEEKEIAIDKFNNATLEGRTQRKQKVDKANNVLKEIVKTHVSFCEVQIVKNNDKFGKFNRYYTDLAEMESELKFYDHYEEFKQRYNDSLGQSDSKNSENKDKIVEITSDKDRKLATTKAKFAAIRAKKLDLETQLKAEEVNNKYQLKVIKNSTTMSEEEKQIALADLKEHEIEFSTRLKGALYDLPSNKQINAMEREELNESKHAFVRDRKYLKTNFTPETYATEQVIDMMILEYKIPYNDAAYYASLLRVKEKGEKEKRFLCAEEVVAKQAQLKGRISAYKEVHQDNYCGRSETFREQMKALTNDKFHITILALPFLGILFFTILPLVFSILIAFTNFDFEHKPPMKLFDWYGFQNFINLFTAKTGPLSEISSIMATTLSWTLIWAVFATFTNYFLGIIVALMINKDGIKFKGLWRTIFVITIAVPSFISLLSVGIMLNENGLLADAFGITFGSSDYSQGAIITKTIIILVNIWVGIPYTMLSTTGILLNIPKDLYESSTVDGAGPVTQFFKITMPYILFVTGPYLITTFIGNINNFNVIFFLSNGEPKLAGTVSSVGLGQTDLMITAIYKIVTDPNNAQYGVASAIGILIFAICSFISIIMYNKSGSIQQEDQFQ